MLIVAYTEPYLKLQFLGVIVSLTPKIYVINWDDHSNKQKKACVRPNSNTPGQFLDQKTEIAPEE